MPRATNALSCESASRQGVSLLEVLGCIMAVGFGVWVGAHYLGLNLHSFAYTTLNESEIIEKLPSDWRPAPPAGTDVVTVEDQELELREELDGLKSDVEQLKQGEPVLPAESASVADEQPIDGELELRREKTLAFWSRLGEIRQEVERLQEAAQESASEQNVWKVLEIRQRAYLYGTKAIDAASVDVVDPQALQFAKQLRGWYEQGADLYDEAMKVWQGQQLPHNALSSDQLLDKARQQHDNEALLLFQKGERLREVLIRRYEVPFPGLQSAGEPTPAPREDQPEDTSHNEPY